MQSAGLSSWGLRVLLFAVVAILSSACSQSTAPGEASPESPSASASSDPAEGAFQMDLSVPSEIEVEVSVGGLTDGAEEVSFSGEGSVDPERGLAEVTFDVDEVANSAGFYGHYDSIEVRYEDLTAYAEVVPGEAPWLGIPLREAGPVQGFDIARLREMVLADPLLLLELAAETSGGGDVDLTGGSGAAEALSESFVASSASVTVDDAAGTITLDLAFPVVPSSSDAIDVEIVMELGDETDASIEIPAEDEVSSL